MKAVLIILALVVIAILFGPYVAGYHRGVDGGDVWVGAHCIKWFGSMWCKTH